MNFEGLNGKLGYCSTPSIILHFDQRLCDFYRYDILIMQGCDDEYLEIDYVT